MWSLLPLWQVAYAAPRLLEKRPGAGEIALVPQQDVHDLPASSTAR